MNRCAFESPDLELPIARPHDQTSHFPLTLHRPQVGSFHPFFQSLVPGQQNFLQIGQLEAYAQGVAFTTDYCHDAINNFLEKRPLEFDWDRLSESTEG